MVNTAKIYYDSDGNECNIWQMVKREPHWVANRIQECESTVKQLKDEIDRLNGKLGIAEMDIITMSEQIADLSYKAQSRSIGDVSGITPDGGIDELGPIG